MPFFQNVFTSDFMGPMVLGDRQHNPTYKCRRNSGRGDELVIAWNVADSYDLSGNDADSNSNDTLTLYFCFDPKYKNWAPISVDITSEATSSSAVTPQDIVDALNGDATFAGYFEASAKDLKNGKYQVNIKQKKPVTQFKFYIANGRAESVLKFNARAGIDELPTYFSRHTVANRFVYTDSLGLLIELVPGTYNIDAALINEAVDDKGNSLGYASGTVQADWQLLKGISGIFNFQKITVDGSDRITQIIEYPAGAKAGDFARKVNYSYTSANKNPDKITEIPYTLTGSDLVTP